MPEVEMVQQMSGPRPDGRTWPPVGGVIDVSEDEAAALCHESGQQSHPIAVRVHKRKEETGDDERETETASDPRPADTSVPKAPKSARPAARPARPGVETRD
jgi:hypothetical protein